MADDLKSVKSGTAVLVACLVQTLNETDPTFKDRFLERLSRAYAERLDEAERNELELLSWARELVSGFNFVSGQGKPFLEK